VSDRHNGAKLRTVLDVVTTVATLSASGVLVWFVLTIAPRRPADREITLPTAAISIAGAQEIGDPSAPAVLIAYSDFMCPYCAKFVREGLPELQERFLGPKRLRLVFRHLPLTKIHPVAMRAAFAAECAGRYGQFWQMHDRLFASQERIDQNNLLALSKEVGLSDEQYQECGRSDISEQITARIEADAAEARRMGINATPSFVLGRNQSDGRVRLLRAIRAVPFDQLAMAIDAELREPKEGPQ
jgi:protein-disulfide isomerase